jgi:hypothetical protein
MQIVINTIEGTFIVPAERQSELIYWLNHNAIKVGQQSVKEQTNTQSAGTHLIND